MNNDLINELGTNFINYAMAVNSDRSIPDARTGLKPVTRRILWGAHKAGYSFNKPHVKAARLVGAVMGELHPHGDSSIYGAMVRLSQPWVMRYPLIDWHGSNGSISGDGPAAARYCECRLTKLSEDGMLDGIKKDNVPFMLNYDESSLEPESLPSVFPNLLCNPNTGIGVALATSFLSHNLREVAAAIKDYTEGKEPIIYPDFPTGGLIINKKDIPKIMKTGKGSVKVRAQYKKEKSNLVFYEIPYGTTVEKILTEIGAVCDKKEIEGITEIRDETNKKGVRIVVECKKNTNLDGIAMILFAKTSLQTSISYNQVALVDKTPTLLNLKDCIEIYLNHNISCLCKEAKFDLNKANKRLEIVDGLLKALEDIDNIIALIKRSENAAVAQTNLIDKYDFTAAQAKAIVNMKLGSLANLESIELNNEQAELSSKIEKLTIFLSNKDSQLKELFKRLDNIVEKYGDARRTELIDLETPVKDVAKPVLVASPCVVIISESDTIKKVPLEAFNHSRRGTKGKKLNEVIKATITTNTTDLLLIFSSLGKLHKISVNDIPETPTTAASLLKLEYNETITAVCAQKEDVNYSSVVFITKKGLIKKTDFEVYAKTRNKSTKATKIKEDDELVKVLLITNENVDIMFITHNGFMLRTPLNKINSMTKLGTGVKAINLVDNDYIVSGFTFDNTGNIGIFKENGYGYLIKDEVSVQARAGRGVKCSDSSVADALIIKDTDSLLISGTSSINISASEIPKLNRGALGVKTINGTINKVVVL